MKKIVCLLMLGITGLFSVFLGGCESTSRSAEVVSRTAQSSIEPCFAVDERSKDLDAPDGEVARAVAAKYQLWTPADTVTKTSDPLILKVAFLDGTPDEQAIVRKIAPQWGQHANVRFEFVRDGDSDIRIGFDPTDGHWSAIGTYARHMKGEKTMNLALRGRATAEEARVILHEFGHALGLLHEHQNPALSIKWNERAVIADFQGPPNEWNEEDIRSNVLNRLDVTQTHFTAFDKESIMLYPIPNRWTIGDFETDYNTALSAMDKQFIGELYPFPVEGTEMVLIPAGDYQKNSARHPLDESFYMSRGSPIYIDAFYIDKYEVTNAQFKAFVDANPQWRKDRIPDKYHGGEYLRHWTRNSYPRGKGNHPVVYVSWYAAMAYAEWAGKRLPTDAEWEKAARGGLVSQRYPWGHYAEPGKAHAPSDGQPTPKSTAPVGSYPPNGYGLYDMGGNVSEWCLDEYKEHFFKNPPRRNPFSGSSITHITSNFVNVPNALRVSRGGTYTSLSWLYADGGGWTGWIAWADGTWADKGFRCVKAVTP